MGITDGAVLEQKVSALRARAIASRTPAQMARRLGLDPNWLSELLARDGVRVSGGASHGNTFTATDRRLFEPVKQQLFDAVVLELGAPELVARADRMSPDWWTTSGGKVATSLADVVGIGMYHTTKDRQPIPLWQSRMIWVGFAFSAMMCVVGIGVVLLYIWRWSYMGWRDGSKSSPMAAVALGVLGLVAVAAAAAVSAPSTAGALISGAA
jgi:hypothetical protein